MKKVGTIKETITALNLLLGLDNFASSLGILPINLLIKDKIDKEMFEYQHSIKQIEVQEDMVSFVLKSEITERKDVDRIMTQIYKDFQQLIRKSNVKVLMGVKQGPKSWILNFFLKPTGDVPVANEEDLEFLKDRFNLSETIVKSLVKTINQGSN